MKRRSRQQIDLSALSGHAPQLAEMLVSVAGDIVLVLDDGGVIQNVALGDGAAVPETACSWVGLHWRDTLTGTTHADAEAFLGDLADAGVSRLGHVAHRVSGADVPMSYTAVRLGAHGPTLAVGRDLRAVSTMQERLIQTQRDLERDYWQHRQAETRYRLLFKVSTEATLILDAASGAVLDANSAAGRLLGRTVERILGRPASTLFDDAAFPALAAALSAARETARTVEGAMSLGDGHGTIQFSVTQFRNDATEVLLVMLRGGLVVAPGLAPTLGDGSVDEIFADLVRRSGDAIVVCDAAARIALVNQSFLDMVRWPQSERIDGTLLSVILGDRHAEPLGNGLVGSIIATARRDGSVGLCRAQLTRGTDAAVAVELSATLVGRGDFIGFIIRIAHHQDGSPGVGSDPAERNVH